MKNTKVDQQVKEVEAQTKDREDLTKVKVRFTAIKFYSKAEDTAKDVKVLGKLSLPEAKAYVKELDVENILIEKANVYESFEVSTVELYNLKK